MELLIGALRLDPSAFANLLARPDALRIALWVVFLGGFSSAAGQSVVLFAARVSPRRFVASLLLSASLFVGVFLFWTASIWLIARYGYGADEPFATGLRTVGLAYAPQLFGFFVLVPYFGSGIGVGMSIWNLLAIAIATEVAFGIDLIPALVSSAAGWVLLQLAQRTIGWPLARLARWAKTRVAGVRLDDIDDLLRRDGP